MASDKEKDLLDDEEIVDLTDVVEEGTALVDKPARASSDDSDRGVDRQDDLSDLFEGMDSENESQKRPEKDVFNDLFRDESVLEDKDAWTRGEGGWPWSGKNDRQDRPVGMQDPIHADRSEQSTESASAGQDWQDGSKELASAKQDKDHGLEDLTRRLQPLIQKMDALENSVNSLENDFSRKAVASIEEKGPELAFFSRAMEELRKDLSLAIEKQVASFMPDLASTSEEDFKSVVLETVEEKGLESAFAQDLAFKIMQQTQELVDEKSVEMARAFDAGKYSDHGSRIEKIEQKLAGLALPDPVEMKRDLVSELDSILNQKIEDFMTDLITDLNLEGLKQEVIKVLDARLEKESASRQAEIQDIKLKLKDFSNSNEEMQNEVTGLNTDIRKIHEMITSLDKTMQEMQEKSAFVDKSVLEIHEKLAGLDGVVREIQERLSGLGTEMEQSSEKMAAVQAELTASLDSSLESFATREDLAAMSSQIRSGLEEYVLKRVPEAAARVIREEVAAMTGKTKQ